MAGDGNKLLCLDYGGDVVPRGYRHFTPPLFNIKKGRPQNQKRDEFPWSHLKK